MNTKNIKNTIQEIFPNSFVKVKQYLNLTNSISIVFALGKDEKEWNNRIINNDRAHHNFMIRLDNKEEKGVLECLIGGCFYINPPKGSYLAMETQKVSFRKTIGDEKKIVKSLKNYFTKLKASLKENKANIFDYDLVGKF